jgi:hypothetical protein
MLVQAVADEGVVLPEADWADQTFATLRERDVSTAGTLLTRRRDLGSVPEHGGLIGIK